MLLTIALSLAALQEAEAAVPAGRWQIEAELTTCRMKRDFRAGSAGFTIEIHPKYAGPESYLRIIQSAQPLTAKDRAAFPFVSTGENEGSGEGVATIVFADQPPLRMKYDWYQLGDPAGRMTVFSVSDAFLSALAADTHLSMKQIATPITARMPLSTEAFASLARCRQQVRTDWGLAAQLEEAAQPAEPIDAMETVFGSTDVPVAIQAAGGLGRVSATLLVDATGKPMRCRLRSTPSQALGDFTCARAVEALMFKPAINSSGRSIASFYNFAVVWS